MLKPFTMLILNRWMKTERTEIIIFLTKIGDSWTERSSIKTVILVISVVYVYMPCIHYLWMDKRWKFRMASRKSPLSNNRLNNYIIIHGFSVCSRTRRVSAVFVLSQFGKSSIIIMQKRICCRLHPKPFMITHTLHAYNDVQNAFRTSLDQTTATNNDDDHADIGWTARNTIKMTRKKETFIRDTKVRSIIQFMAKCERETDRMIVRRCNNGKTMTNRTWAEKKALAKTKPRANLESCTDHSRTATWYVHSNCSY